MSMPSIEIADINLENALANVVASIALEEAALSHVLNAEGEKLQAAQKISTSINELISVNESVYNILSGTMQMEQILLEKLNAAVKVYEKYK